MREPETDTETHEEAGSTPADCSLRSLLPGEGWSRPYKNSPHVWEDAKGNRVIVNYGVNCLTLRPADGETFFCYDHREPFREALKRNPNRRRAGLAAARRIFEAN